MRTIASRLEHCRHYNHHRHMTAVVASQARDETAAAAGFELDGCRSHTPTRGSSGEARRTKQLYSRSAARSTK
jgi:hypothetical protein